MAKAKKKTSLTGARKELKERRKAIAAERDKLNDLASDIVALRDDADEALESLDDAITALSKLQ